MLIDGTHIANEIKEKLKEEITHYLTLKKRPPKLAVTLIGNHPASQIYVKRKREACQTIGVDSLLYTFDPDISKIELINHLESLNRDPSVDGILLQLPLPPHLNPLEINSYLAPEKDIDGFHPINFGKLLSGDPTGFVPCTPLGIKKMLEYYQLSIRGKHAVILGRSNIVGKPMAALLLQNSPLGSPTVTIAHSQSSNLKEITSSADLLIVAIGQPLFISPDMVKPGAIVIDVGINKSSSSEKKLVGDVDFSTVQQKSSWITPVPGGVGPMTIAMLLSNTIRAWKINN